jgi:superfamily II DNA or RNA helicase
MNKQIKTLRDVNPKISYKKFKDPNINEIFYNPCMSVSKEYNRAVGFFSSSIYSLIYQGLDDFIKNGGKSKILCSYKIDSKDLNAIHEGYKERKENYISTKLMSELSDWDMEGKSKNGLVLLSSLIKHKILDVKIALIDAESDNYIKNMFHEKLGVFTDFQSDSIVFHGSNNETYSGLANDGNYESFDVFISWDDSRDGQRCRQYKDDFNSMWKDKFPGIKVFDIPSKFSKKLNEYAANDEVEIFELIKEFIKPKKDNNISKRIEDIEPRKHQKNALKLWKENGYSGILKHATGSGKTITGIFGLYNLKKEKDFIGTIILVPGDLLLKQWKDELEEKLGKENLDLILCGSGNNDWKKGAAIKRSFSKSKKHKIILSTYDTATSEKFIKSILSVKGGDLLIIADEVHRIGSKGKLKIMNTFMPRYRLGLSATPERENDKVGTNHIIDYFGKILDEYNLRDAIRDGWLTKYFYYVQHCSLTIDEEDDWNNLSKEINKDYAQYISGGKKNEALKKRIDSNVMVRARIVKGAKNKIQKAVDIIKNNLRSNQKWLIYCEDNTQIDELQLALKRENIIASRYTSGMEGDKEETMKYFTKQDSILLSIRCLDEGVNIPTVTHALVIASSQTAREYIQRRGRVLRLSKNKNFSRIYDILVLPTHNDTDISNIALSEIKRSLDFSRDSENSDEIHELERMLIKKNINPKTLIKEGFENE